MSGIVIHKILQALAQGQKVLLKFQFTYEYVLLTVDGDYFAKKKFVKFAENVEHKLQ